MKHSRKYEYYYGTQSFVINRVKTFISFSYFSVEPEVYSRTLINYVLTLILYLLLTIGSGSEKMISHTEHVNKIPVVFLCIRHVYVFSLKINDSNPLLRLIY